MHILVEGHTDKDFLELYCKYLNIEVRIDIVDGKDNLINRINLIRDDEKHLIIFDADDDYSNSKDNIENQMKQMNIPKENYEIFLLPNNEDDGNLEILIEKIARHKELLNCFESYEKCINGLVSKNNNIKPPNKKDKIFAYMQSFGFKNPIKPKEFDLSIYVDFEDKYLETLKDFLLDHNINKWKF